MTDVMSKFKVGDKVQISKDSEYYLYGVGNNPRDTTGEVTEVGDLHWMPVMVQWPKGLTNSYDESDLVHAVDVVHPVRPPEPPLPCTTAPTVEHTGGSSSYYTVRIDSPTTPYKPAYDAECNDIIEALNMSYAEANVFKAVWRTAAARMGKKKKGNNAVYDAEKIIFFSGRMLVKAKKEDV